FAALLVGACLRGAHVLVIAPALANAPSSGFPQMARAQELLSRLLLVRRELGPAIAAAGGDLRTGLYALPPDRRGFASRADRWERQVSTTPFLQALLPFAPALAPVVAEAARDTVDSSGATRSAVLVPKLHQKVQFFATGEFWRAISASQEWPRLMAAYLRYREATYSPAGEYVQASGPRDSLEQIAARLVAPAHAAPRPRASRSWAHRTRTTAACSWTARSASCSPAQSPLCRSWISYSWSVPSRGSMIRLL